MIGDRVRKAGPNLVAAGLAAVFAALAVWTVAEIVSVRHRLTAAQADNRALAQQVRELGGTPRAGPAGQAGSPGPQGPAGSPGSPGQTGRNGQNGNPGQNGPSGPTGRPGLAGAPGAVGQPGAKGDPGATGPQGPRGDTGPAGATGPPPSSWTWTYLGVTYTCTQTAPAASTYNCTPGSTPPSARRRKS